MSIVGFVVLIVEAIIDIGSVDCLAHIWLCAVHVWVGWMGEQRHVCDYMSAVSLFHTRVDGEGDSLGSTPLLKARVSSPEV